VGGQRNLPTSRLDPLNTIVSEAAPNSPDPSQYLPFLQLQFQTLTLASHSFSRRQICFESHGWNFRILPELAKKTHPASFAGCERLFIFSFN